jgi:hypothetical protein
MECLPGEPLPKLRVVLSSLRREIIHSILVEQHLTLEDAILQLCSAVKLHVPKMRLVHVPTQEVVVPVGPLKIYKGKKFQMDLGLMLFFIDVNFDD